MKVQWWMLGLMVLLPACDGDGNSTQSGGSGGSGGADGGSGGMVSSGGSGGDGGAVSSGGSGGGGGGGSGGAGGATCSESQPCANAAESCVYPMDSCGGSGVCKEITCDGTEPHHGPVCLCDGQIFELNAECLVWDQSLPIAPADTCSTGTYSCANTTCKQHTQICVVTYEGPGSTAQGSCVDVAGAPGTCLYGIADCGCLDLTALGCSDPTCCSADGFYLETITLSL